MSGPAPITVGVAVRKYLATLTVPSTHRAYAAVLNPLAANFGESTPLADITPEDVAEWLQERWGGTSAGTRNLRLTGVRSASAWWAARGWIPPGLTSLAKTAKARPELPPEVLSPEEVTALLAQCSRRGHSGIRNYALIMMLYRSGLRLEEALAVRPGDIDHGARSIRLLKTKSGEAQTRYYHASAEDALNRWLDRRRALGINGHSPLFCTLEGRPLKQEYVRKTLWRYAAKAGISKRVHPHGLRHTFAAELEAAGEPWSTISKLLGHADVATTARYLGKLTNAQAGRALAQVDLPSVGKIKPSRGEA